MKAAHSLAEVIEKFGVSFNHSPEATPYIQKSLRAIRTCRTAVMGGHVDVCSNPTCKHIHISYNSCRNRHCSTCQSTQKERWLTTMNYRTLPVSYFHCVFTIPHEFNGLCIRYPKLMYDLLFKVVWASLNECSKHPQYGIIKTGMTAVLHTWGQNLSLHPHLHCIVPAGGITQKGKWKHLKGSKAINKRNKDFLYPIDELKKKYRAKFMAALRKLIKLGLVEQQEPGFLNYVYNKEWVVYAKRPGSASRFKGPYKIIEYLGRYTHKIAISNHRIQKINEYGVQFAYKDYADKNKTKSMTLAGEEFLRRFSQHILPTGFTKVRHFGLHAGANQQVMDQLHQELYNKVREPKLKETWQEIAFKKTGYVEAQCPKCSQNTLQTVGVWHTNKPPPDKYKYLIMNM